MTDEEHYFHFFNGPFDEHGWYEVYPGFHCPGKPFLEKYPGHSLCWYECFKRDLEERKRKENE